MILGPLGVLLFLKQLTGSVNCLSNFPKMGSTMPFVFRAGRRQKVVLGSEKCQPRYSETQQRLCKMGNSISFPYGFLPL